MQNNKIDIKRIIRLAITAPNAIRDMAAGSLAIAAMHWLSNEGQIHFRFHILDHTLRICALSQMKESAIERSMDEPVPEGIRAVECGDHCHWEADSEPGTVDLLAPMKQVIEQEWEQERVSDMLNRIFHTADPDGEPLDPGVFAAMFTPQDNSPTSFDANAAGMGLDLSDPEAMRESLENLSGGPVSMFRLDDEPYGQAGAYDEPGAREPRPVKDNPQA